MLNIFLHKSSSPGPIISLSTNLSPLFGNSYNNILLEAVQPLPFFSTIPSNILVVNLIYALLIDSIIKS